MTRVNVIPVQELSDQWLVAEYRELPRCLKGNISINDAPTHYVLGKGHMKWARRYGLYTNNRMIELINEMKFRGFKPAYITDLQTYLTDDMLDYKPSAIDVQINIQRLQEKYKGRENFYRWTKRTKPNYLTEAVKGDR